MDADAPTDRELPDALVDGRWTGEDPIEAIVGELLREREDTLATAESLTGGLIGSTITDVPGSSDYFDRGFVTYAYDAKRQELAVPREALDAHGAVSRPVAEAMARGTRDRADTTWGLSATGIAGPGGGRDGKPVGLVYVGVAYAAEWGTEESFVEAVRFRFDGDRTAVKHKSVDSALAVLLAAVRELR
ncbi:nicotinamide-nucleotide amidase [Halopenitus malekzadehii]|uniref:Nicotinamide-nucleotide amidase n=1 Tax=Halopenitus malekzadehii TaxID=1267564 RepID=A0A1H6ID71_9EURY|nr:CinA family protein [Halopenitus malekzadehii]SEH47255.1 nicotinamide-nucleotide amidase [Halopenitus malekzadehii]